MFLWGGFQPHRAPCLSPACQNIWISTFSLKCISFMSCTECQTRMKHFLYTQKSTEALSVSNQRSGMKGAKILTVTSRENRLHTRHLVVCVGFILAVVRTGYRRMCSPSPSISSAPGCDVEGWKDSVQCCTPHIRPVQLHHREDSSVKMIGWQWRKNQKQL